MRPILLEKNKPHRVIYLYSKTRCFNSLLTPSTPRSIKNSHICIRRTLSFTSSVPWLSIVAFNLRLSLHTYAERSKTQRNVTVPFLQHQQQVLLLSWPTVGFCHYKIKYYIFKIYYNVKQVYQILLIHAVNVRSNDGKIFHTLRRACVWYVNGHFYVISYATWFTFKWAWQCWFRKHEAGYFEL